MFLAHEIKVHLDFWPSNELNLPLVLLIIKWRKICVLKANYILGKSGRISEMVRSEALSFFFTFGNVDLQLSL